MNEKKSRMQKIYLMWFMCVVAVIYFVLKEREYK